MASEHRWPDRGWENWMRIKTMLEDNISMKHERRTLIPALLLCVCLGCTERSSGCTPQEPESAEAERLFDEGAVEMMREIKKRSRACEDVRERHDTFAGLG